MIGEGIHTQLLQPAQIQKETVHAKPTHHKDESTALLAVS